MFCLRKALVGNKKIGKLQQAKNGDFIMKLLKFVLPIALAVCALQSSNLPAFCVGTNEPIHNDNLQRDFLEVQTFVNSKRSIPLEEKDCALSISGDVRFGWAHINERVNCVDLRGHQRNAKQDPDTDIVVIDRDLFNGIPFSKNAFGVMFNMYVDYVCDRAWGVAWLQFDDIAGVQQNRGVCGLDPAGCGGSGCCGDLCLKKAYIGYNICADGCSRIDVELGRRPLYTIFDSRIQFQARFDGLLLKFGQGFDCYGDFVVDERVNHFAYVTELGLLNIMDTGFEFKYSFIDWTKNGRNVCGDRDPAGWQFRNSQWSLAYDFNPEIINKDVSVYGAVLCNHAARRIRDPETNRNFGKQNMAWYLGFIVGRVCGEGDFALDINYQWVEAKAIPDCDVSGISNGNLLNQTFTEIVHADGEIVTVGTRRGRCNYKGWRFEGLYALTDNLVLDTSFEFSSQLKRRIGGPHSYSKFEIDAIYAF